MAKILKSIPTNETVYELGLSRIRRAYEIYDHIAVSFSGGKDSTACLQLTLDVARELDRLPLDVVFYDEEAIPPETVEYMHRVNDMPDVNLRWLCYPIQHRNGTSKRSPYWHPWDPACPELWCRAMPDCAIVAGPDYPRLPMPESNKTLFSPADHGQVGFIFGLRAEEGLNRRRAVSTRTWENYISPDPHAPGVNLVKPIYDWRTIDIWTAPRQLGWDYNHAYDLMALAGISPSVQRIAPPYGEQPMKSLWMFATCWPELWDKMLDRVPGAHTAAMYSRGDLYGFGGKAEPPDGMTWQEAIVYYADKFPMDEAKIVKHSIQQLIRLHKKSTGRRVPEYDADPTTGISWEYLLRIAIRGDLKERMAKQMLGRATHATTERGTRY